jgi:hypothetical protein
MSFYNTQSTIQQNLYKKDLQIIGSLSNLFSDSNTPYLYYRIAEKMFCKAFDATDLSRGDVSYDAVKDNLGIGLKTYLRSNNKSIQKIAEFNKDKILYDNLSLTKKVHKIASLRNHRLQFTNNLYDIEKSIYHCVVRDQGKFFIFEEDTHAIDINAIKNIKQKKSSITFDDGLHEYTFSLSKSTLMKRFNTFHFLDTFNVDIIADPLDALYSIINSNPPLMHKTNIQDTIYLPLYGSNHKVYDNSGLNQWNAKGRKRDIDEIYIPIPKKFYTHKPKFFPEKDVIFTLNLPNKTKLQAKVCQAGSKALMSNPNKALGKWLLRDVFKLSEGELVTNNTLYTYGIDSVRLDKINDTEYDINFAKLDSYENFIFKLENNS